MEEVRQSELLFQIGQTTFDWVYLHIYADPRSSLISHCSLERSDIMVSISMDSGGSSTSSSFYLSKRMLSSANLFFLLEKWNVHVTFLQTHLSLNEIRNACNHYTYTHNLILNRSFLFNKRMWSYVKKLKGEVTWHLSLMPIKLSINLQFKC